MNILNHNDYYCHNFSNWFCISKLFLQINVRGQLHTAEKPFTQLDSIWNMLKQNLSYTNIVNILRIHILKYKMISEYQRYSKGFLLWQPWHGWRKVPEKPQEGKTSLLSDSPHLSGPDWMMNIVIIFMITSVVFSLYF